MRVAMLLLGIAFAATAPPAAFAGVYNTGEPDEGPLDENFLGKFYGTLKILQTIAAPKIQVERPLRKRYLLQEELFAKVDPAKLSAEEKLNFSAMLLRRRRAADAIQLLMPATRQHADVFLLQSHLATAYQQSGDKGRARDTMRDCLDLWPKEWHELSDSQRLLLGSAGWNEGPFGFYREAETYYHKLLKLRSREPKEMDAEFQAVDALFDVKFVGDSGEFEPGKISKTEKAKLPKNARMIVQQLLVWTPDDPRLYWLLGEVFNAQGEVTDIKAARKIFDELVWEYKVRAPDLKTRRQVLNDWAEPAQSQGDFNPDAVDDAKPKSTGGPAFEWRGLLVAFGTGVVVTIFGLWQIQEIRRRRHRT